MVQMAVDYAVLRPHPHHKAVTANFSGATNFRTGVRVARPVNSGDDATAIQQSIVNQAVMAIHQLNSSQADAHTVCCLFIVEVVHNFNFEHITSAGDL